jgi:hypothetical protein
MESLFRVGENSEHFSVCFWIFPNIVQKTKNMEKFYVQVDNKLRIYLPSK